MKIVIATLLTATTALYAIPALSAEADDGGSESNSLAAGDADRLYSLVQQARADLRELRQRAGLHAHASGPHVDPEGHHEGESEADRARESAERDGHEDGSGTERGHESGGERGHAEGREGGEHAREGGHGEGRERGHREGGERGGREHAGESRERSGAENDARIEKSAKHAQTYRNGAHLVLQYNKATQAFVGKVTNTTEKPLSQVRVEIHLSNGLELGPTKRVDLQPGATIPVELSALGESFTHWVTHPEAGIEEGHGEGDEESEGHAGREERGEHAGEGRGEHGSRERGEGGQGEGGGDRPGANTLRPVYNQLMLLRGEMKAFYADLAAIGAK